MRRAAMRLVPDDWRQPIERDLDEEFPRASLSSAVRAGLIGLRLRADRLLDSRRDTSRRISSRRPPMHDFVRDLRFALRTVLRQPGYALAVVATLAIGIGANTAIFSIFNWILFRPLPAVEHPDELVTIKYHAGNFQGSYFVSFRDYADLRDNARTTLAGVSASTPLRMDLLGSNGTEPLEAELVTTNYLSVFRVVPIAGRDFAENEEKPGAEPTVIISRRLWTRLFEEDPAAIGRTLTLNGRPFTIVGVAPGAFQGRSMVTRTDAWLTPAAYATLLPDKGATFITSRRETIFGDHFARLRPGATLAQGQAEASAVVNGVPDFANRSQRKGPRSQMAPKLYPGVGNETFASERLKTIFRLLMGAVGLLLVLACANAANLLLAQTTGRRREIAVRQAIGASRLRIVRQHLVEGLVLSLAAGALGLGLGIWLTWLFDGMRIIAFLPAVSGVEIDWRVAAFALVSSLLTGVIFAAAPSVASSRVDLLASLKDGATTTGGRRRLREGLVAIQVALAVLLLTGAGLFIRTLHNVRGIDLGFRPTGIVSAAIQPSRFGLDTTQSKAYVRELLERMRSAPGVQSAAFTWTTTFSGNRSDTSFAQPNAPDKYVAAATTTVSDGFFATMGIPLLAGRDFTAAELRTEDKTSGPIIISKRLAEELFPSGGALGSKLTLRYPEGKIAEVVGVVGDVRSRAVTDQPEEWAYTPAVDPSWGTIQVRSALPAAQVIATIREVARSIDPVVAPHDREAFGTAVDRALGEQRLFARVSGIFAAVGALLAAIGIYGMMAAAIAERRREFGIRLALGASGAAVVRMVVRSAVTLAGIGLLFGVGGASAARRLFESRLYGVSGFDSVSVFVAVACILLLSVAASALPALRASRVDPVTSLRVD
jgi:putative ABC transport system permease protein